MLCRLTILAALLLALAACASPPYSKPGVTRDQASSDYQDCYSLGALDHFTPDTKASINKATRACMKARGYQESCLNF
jgi:hypothetical protein